jgi:DUF218 domain
LQVVSDFEIREGTPGLKLDEIGHILIPGRGRDAVGRNLSRASRDRVLQAHALYVARGLAAKDGTIVCSGYKTPGDVHGGDWSPADSPDETFVGIPEADSMRNELLALGIDAAGIRVERHSVDTVTNFVRVEAEELFGDDRPVAIIAQESHLTRMLEVVAPRTLRRAYMGVIVPEQCPKDIDGRISRLVSQAVLYGVTPGTPRLVELADRRIGWIWQVADKVTRATRRPVYYTDN